MFPQKIVSYIHKQTSKDFYIHKNIVGCYKILWMSVKQIPTENCQLYIHKQTSENLYIHKISSSWVTTNPWCTEPQILGSMWQSLHSFSEWYYTLEGFICEQNFCKILKFIPKFCNVWARNCVFDVKMFVVPLCEDKMWKRNCFLQTVS